jgi:N-acetylglucosamine-6-phosphate deacetylase
MTCEIFVSGFFMTGCHEKNNISFKYRQVAQQLKIYNGQIITPSRIIKGGTILVTNDRIMAVNEGNIEAPGALEIDAGGKYIAPGFIDIHVHGGGGHDFMDNSTEAFLEIARLHARHGTTAMFPTTLSGSKPDLLETLKIYDIANRQNCNGAQFMGMHLEGPYFALAQCGAQDPRYIRDPDREEYREILATSPAIKRWSAAPELKGAIEFGKYITSKGVLAAIAHTDAVYDEVVSAFENGYTLATHLYSGMSGVTRRNAFRYAGVIESAYLIDEMDVEIIADGIHLPPPLLKLVYKIKGPGKIALITDAMRAAGMPPGESILGSLKNGLKVIVEDDVAKLPDRGSFAGSVATADRLVRTMVTMAGIPLIEAVRMASGTPASIMNTADKKGSLEAGKDADIIIFDNDINIEMTIIKGKVIYSKNPVDEKAGR